MVRVAIPVTEGKLSEYLCKCHHFEIFEIDANQVKSDEIAIPPVCEVDDLPKWFEEIGVTDVITHMLSKSIIGQFAQKRINLYVGIDKNTPQQIIKDYLNAQLQSSNKIINQIMESHD